MMIINGKTEEMLSVISDKPRISKSRYKSNIYQTNSLTYNAYVEGEDLRSFECGFAILGTNSLDINKKSSKFIEEVKNCTIEYEGLNYNLMISDNGSVQETFSVAEYIKLKFNILDCYESEKSITTNSSTSLNINSPKSCYANLEIRANIYVISCEVKINDTKITVRNIKGNETIYIGSGKVTAGGKSKINDVDIWEFPILNPGLNKISVNREDVTLTVKYNERW